MYKAPGYLHGIYVPEYLSYIGRHNESKSAEKQIINLVKPLFGFWIEVNKKLIYNQALYKIYAKTEVQSSFLHQRKDNSSAQ